MNRLSLRRPSHTVKAETDPHRPQTWVDSACSPSAHKLVTFVTALLVYLYLSSPPPPGSAAYSSTPAPPPPPLHTDPPTGAPFRPPPLADPSLPRTVHGPIEGLVDYLDARWKLAGPGGDVGAVAAGGGGGAAVDVWLTVGNGTTVEGATAGQGLFFERLNLERVGRGGVGVRQSVLVVVCEDDECLGGCEEKGLWCYGGAKLAAGKKTKVS